MKRKVLLSSLAIALAMCLATSSLVMALDDHLIADTIIGSTEEKIYSTATLEDDFADNRVLVVLTNEASVSLDNYNLSDFSEINCASVSNLTQAATNLVQAELRGEDPDALYSVNSDTVTFDNFYDIDADTFNRVLCIELAEPGKEKVLETMDALMERDDVLYAVPDYPITMCSTIPNDPRYEDQWAAEKIQLPEAWDISTGSATIHIGVLDSGIDADHEDLIGKVLTEYSRDFTSGAIVTPSVVSDPNGHGTHVAGIIAAKGNNATGICGVSWNSRVISLRVFDSMGEGTVFIMGNGVDYAITLGIPILNFSGAFKLSNDSAAINTVNEIIESYNGLFVCAAGNNEADLDDEAALDDDTVYPAKLQLPNLITVGASTSSDGIRYDSNYGSIYVDLFAPGDSILSCWPDDKYLSTGQTSTAAPFVSGVAALILSKHPTVSATVIKQWIMDGVDQDSGLTANCVSGGRLNAYKAVNNHLYTYSSINALKHTGSCVCGITKTENHTWTTVSTADNFTNATYRTCTKCGYTTTVSTLADTSAID